MTYRQILLAASGFGFIAGFIVGMFLGLLTWASLMMGV